CFPARGHPPRQSHAAAAALSREVKLRGETVDLTPREFDLLYYFARHPGEVFSRLAAILSQSQLNALFGQYRQTRIRALPASSGVAIAEGMSETG
ncbi:winged helix-turn-helix domain-containing protein, partial [Klebsiella pneumoniae]|uniref:winged helix-turn-helix domain-containing protein n=1 Tax=Klebsiella pneumoniae TaxID=573 RepID=UPI00210C836A